jgi:predicted ATPase
LLGREREREVLDRLLDGGRGGVLVVHGEAGVGKTALLEYAVEAARGFRIARTSGVEAEMELPFAAAQQLCSPLPRLFGPSPAARARGARRRVRTHHGARAKSVLSWIGGPQPAIRSGRRAAAPGCVDDAHWLDRASARALAFVARRLLAEKIAVVFAARQVDDALGGLPSLHVAPLRRRDARALLESVLPARLDEAVLERIVVETRGNPLALLELPSGLTPTELAGGFGLPTAMPLSASIEESFTRRLEDLLDDARVLSLLAAAEPVGDPLLLWRAAEKLGISAAAAAASETDGLLKLGEQVTFRHPLVRSAVYGSAPVEQRRAVHAALTEVTDRAADPDRRAWHLASSTTYTKRSASSA